jgi:glycosyl transferase family 2
VIVLLLVTQNESALLRWNLQHHLAWGVDHVAVADNASTDDTADVVREFGDAASYERFPDFHDRQTVRTAMLDAIRSRRPVDWAGVADTDEFFWSPEGDLASLLADAPAETVAVNFDMKLFLPTALDRTGVPVFMGREHRSASADSPLHTSYSVGKTFYRSSWLTTVTDEHWAPEVPHPVVRADTLAGRTEPGTAVHHYMVQDEEQFVQKVTRLIAWAQPPSGLLARRRWRALPPRERDLPRWTAPFKKEWWSVYQQGGEAAVRDYYRNVYTLSAARVAETIEQGQLVDDPAFATWARARYGVTP